jgi:hypothetical protein
MACACIKNDGRWLLIPLNGCSKRPVVLICLPVCDVFAAIRDHYFLLHNCIQEKQGRLSIPHFTFGLDHFLPLSVLGRTNF